MNKIGCEQIIDTAGISISVKMLTCQICYCLIINPRQCQNKKCGQMFCQECIKIALQHEPICPYCRIRSKDEDFSERSIDSRIIITLNNLKLFCFHQTCSKKLFRIDKYLAHVKENGDIFTNNDKSVGIQEETDLKAYISFPEVHCSYCKKIRSNCSNFVECKICAIINCKDCSNMCHICKQIICISCIIKCDNCGCTHANSYVCKVCISTDLPIFFKCTFEMCNDKYCINCVKICNACLMPRCKNHICKCEGCEEFACEKHYKPCEECSSTSNKTIQPCCFKRCILACQNCLSYSTLFCNVNIHPYVTSLACGHEICSTCVKKCGMCNKEKCPLCFSIEMLFCFICNKHYCNECCKFCSICECSYCGIHSCINCKQKLFQCLNCLLNESRIFCQECSKEISVCNECETYVICSLQCYLAVSEKTDHLCEMFKCKQCLFNTKESYTLSFEEKYERSSHYQEEDIHQITRASELNHNTSNKKSSLCNIF